MAVKPPGPRQPPLNALRAFEAAARLGGFAAAAEELNVTPGAISAHVKALETELGARLFDRNARGLQLTGLGARVLPAFTEAFDRLGQATQTLRAEAAPNVVHIAALPSVAQLWLSPRLPRLRAEAPEIEISITAMEAPPNLKRAPYDLCLFFGPEPDGRLAEDVIFPVCAPALAEQLHQPEDLNRLPCLTDSTWSEDWHLWAQQAAPGLRLATRGPVFSLYALAVEETVNGAGVLIGHQALIAGHLEAGTLVAPFDAPVRLPGGLRMSNPRPLRANTPAGRVARWLRDSAPA